MTDNKKRGRPKAINPRSKQYRIRLTDDECEALKTIAKELGDVAWYLAVSAQALGFDLETILQMNVEKLKARYPHGFDAGHSQHRSSGDI